MQITTLDDLTALYNATNPNSLHKETAFLTPAYRRWIELAPFFAIATNGPGGLDCSPRGDAVGQVFRVLDDTTIAIPDRRGNNRLDTLKNIIHDPKVALLFLTPGIDETVRINGKATITTYPELVNSFAVNGKLPATVIVVAIEAVYFQCARALKRAQLWDPDMQIKHDQIPSAGEMTKGALPDFDAEDYDAALQERQAKSLY